MGNYLSYINHVLHLSSFHTQTLKLYAALCFQSNHKAQHIICKYCDEKQLLYAINSNYMPGRVTRFCDFYLVEFVKNLVTNPLNLVTLNYQAN